MELQVRMDTVTSGSNATVAKDSSRQSVTTTATTASAAAAAAPMLKRKFNQHVQIPKTDRLVIDLRDDSSDSSDEDEVVEDAISAFIRSARQSVDQKTNPASNAVSALPLHEQEEYLRLKGEIERRENKALAASASSAAAAATAQKLRAKSPTDATTGSPNAPVVQKSPEELPAPVSMNSATTIVEKTVEVLGTVAEPSKATQQTDVQSDSVMQPECNDPREAEVAQVVSPEQTTGEESKAAKEPVAAESQVEKSSEVVISKSALTTNVALQANVDSSPKPSVPVKSGSSISEKLKASAEILHAKKVAALKQQLLQKKYLLFPNIALTLVLFLPVSLCRNAAKDALKSQLELVDKNRALLERSSQEVVRLKAMLQSAEETERQFKLQLNNSQSQLQQLSKKMLFLEKELSALHNGATLPR